MKFDMKTTYLVITTGVIALGVWDLLTVYVAKGFSVSDFMIWAGFNRPFFVFVVGFCCGHFWGYVNVKDGDGNIT